MQSRRYHERISEDPLPRIITAVTNDRIRYFSIPMFAQLAHERLIGLAKTHGIYLYAFAVIPDHIHIIVRKAHGKTISDFMHSFKRYISRQVGKWHDEIHGQKMSRESFWQTSFHQKLIYSQGSFAERIFYVANNAVKHGIVKSRKEYPWAYVVPEYEHMADLNGKGGVNNPAFRTENTPSASRPPFS